MLRLVLAWLHLLALAIGLAAVWTRGASLWSLSEDRALARAFAADTAWGAAAALWISTGLWRLLAGTEKPTSYYMHNDAFFAKMGLLVVILALETWPMLTLIKWRVARGKGTFDLAAHAPTARRIAVISWVQAALGTAMVLLAVAMARGYGVHP
jgi:putative membrane protein